jgi:hypothetical protein
MKKQFIFYLIFFLIFIFQFKAVESLSTSQCRYYDLVSGDCLSGSGYFWSEIAEAPSQVPEVAVKITPSATDAFFSLTVQFFLIVLLTVIIVMLLESLLESH